MKDIEPVESTVARSTPIGDKELVGVAESGAEALVPRDQWDRPLIVPPEGHKDPCEPRKGKGGGCKCMVGYTRVSTLSESLSDPFGLNRYQKGNVLKGLVHRPALLNLARVTTNKSDLYALVDVAEELGDNRGAAENGTFFHRITELVDKGLPLPDGLPDNVLAMVDAYVHEMVRIGARTLEAEQFVVQDYVKAAGTYDKRIVTNKHDRPMIADLKTGQELDHQVLKATIQIATYAASKPYDIGTEERTPLDVDKDRGVLIWCPWADDPADAECEARWVDCVTGREWVREALRVREARKLKPEQMFPRIR